MIIMKKILDDSLEFDKEEKQKITLKKMLISNDNNQNHVPKLRESFFYIIILLLLFSFIWIFN